MKHYTDIVISPAGVAVPNAQIDVYIPTGTTTHATLYSDDGVTTTTNPIFTDSFGRFGFFVADGIYDIKVTSGTVSYTLSKIEIADVLENNAADALWPSIKLLNTGSPTIFGGNLLGPSVNNSVTLLPGTSTVSFSPVTGNSADQLYGSNFNVTANTAQVFKGLRVTSVVKHTTGTANIAYRLSLGGTLTTSITTVGAASQIVRIVYEIFYTANNTCIVVTTLTDSGAGTTKNQIDTITAPLSNTQTYFFTFSVANTDAVTPQIAYVEMIQ